ncbi:MaoC/PaaZ C-terminal domain-containing protein [Xanthobacter sp. V3C-3]|uniref:MaoC/PaaZ C-terminal domain-containing protein n=1 Tax=Xanthobacter lutulentifluminis TaxID=3119935 RepID=UPI00372B0671
MGRVFGEFHVGQRFVTPGRTITEADIVAYAGLTGDYNPVHCNEEFARETPFGSRVAHGPMGVGLAFGLAARIDLIDGTVVALLGVTWDFKAPMRPGSTIRAEITVTETRDVREPSQGLVALAFSLLDQDDRLVQTGSARLLMRRSRPVHARWGELPPDGQDLKSGG